MHELNVGGKTFDHRGPRVLLTVTEVGTKENLLSNFSLPSFFLLKHLADVFSAHSGNTRASAAFPVTLRVPAVFPLTSLISL